jgi:hypothetical protein
MRLSLFVTANAKGIYKTYKDLTNSMFIDKALLNITGIKHTGIYSDKEYVKSIYDKYKDEVNTCIDNMNTAEISRIEYNIDGKIFKIQIAKGIKGNFISYGFDGYSTYENEFGYEYTRSMYEDVLKSSEEFQTIDELKETAGICPVPDYIPQDFNLIRTHLSYINQSSKILDRVGLMYQRNEDEILFITLSRERLAIDNIGMPEELIQAAGLNQIKSTDNINIDDINDTSKNAHTDTPEDLIEMLDVINGYQAVYLEQHTKNPQEENLNTLNSINIFLGNNAKLPILRIGSACFQKDELVKIAENIKIENLPQNQIKADEYFKGIEDEKILAVTNEYLKNIKAGKTEFKINVDKNTEFYRWSHNDTYYIIYRNVDVTKTGSYIQLPFSLDIEFLKEFEHADIQILGKPYITEKTYWCGFVKNNSAMFSVRIEKPRGMYDNGNLDLTDLLIRSMRGAQNEVKTLYNKSGHLYYLIESEKTWMIRTMYEINNFAYECNFTVRKEIMPEEKEVIYFINNTLGECP